MEDKISNLKIEMAEIKGDIKGIKDKLDSFSQKYDERHIELVEMIRDLSKNKANVWVEQAAKWTISLVLSIVLSALVYLVIKR
jgi:hypothetical protein